MCRVLYIMMRVNFACCNERNGKTLRRGFGARSSEVCHVTSELGLSLHQMAALCLCHASFAVDKLTGTRFVELSCANGIARSSKVKRRLN